MHGNITSGLRGHSKKSKLYKDNSEEINNGNKRKLDDMKHKSVGFGKTIAPEVSLEILKTWLHENGASLHNDVEIRIRKEDASVGSISNKVAFGVYAKNEIDEDVILCNLSRNCILSCKNCGIADLLEMSGLDGYFGLTIALMYELALDERSAWYGYLQSLPKEVDIPLFWNREQVDFLGLIDDDLSMKILMDKKHISEEYNTVVKDFLDSNVDVFKYQGLDINGPLFSLEQFKYATALATSRAYEVDNYHGVAMIPFVDIFNHSSSENVHFECNGEVCGYCGEFYCDCSDGEESMDEEENQVSNFEDVESPYASGTDINMSDGSDDYSIASESSFTEPPTKKLRKKDVVDRSLETYSDISISDEEENGETDEVVIMENANIASSDDKFKHLVEKLLGKKLPDESIVCEDTIESKNIEFFTPSWDSIEAPELFNEDEYISSEEEGDGYKVIKVFPKISDDPIADCEDHSLLQMRTVSVCGKDEEIYSKYGDFNDEELLNKYGFIEKPQNLYNKVKIQYGDILKMFMYCDIPNIPASLAKGIKVSTSLDKSLLRTMNSWSEVQKKDMDDITTSLANTHKFDILTISQRLEWWENIGSRIAESVIDKIMNLENDETSDEEINDDYSNDDGDYEESEMDLEDEENEITGEFINSDEDEIKEDASDNSLNDYTDSKIDDTKVAGIDSLLDDLEKSLEALDKADDDNDLSEENESDSGSDISEDSPDEFEDLTESDEDDDEDEEDEGSIKLSKYGQQSFCINCDGQVSVSLVLCLHVLLLSESLYEKFKRLAENALKEERIIDENGPMDSSMQFAFAINNEPEKVKLALSSKKTEFISQYFSQLLYNYCFSNDFSCASWVVLNSSIGPNEFGVYSNIDENLAKIPEDLELSSGITTAKYSSCSPTSLKMRNILINVIKYIKCKVMHESIIEISEIGITSFSTEKDKSRIERILLFGNSKIQILDNGIYILTN